MIHRSSWKDEFSYKSFFFKYKGHQHVFIKPMFNNFQPIYYLYYKIVLSIYTLVWLVLTIIFNNSYLNNINVSLNLTNSSKNEWYYYFSNQAYLIQFIYYTLTTTLLIVIFFHHLKLIGIKDLALRRKQTSIISLRTILASWSNSQQQYPHLLTIILWASNTIILPLSYFVTIIFLVNLIRYHQNAKQILFSDDNNKLLTILLNLNVNLINSVIVTLDFIISLIPVRIYHFYLPLIFSGIYCLVIEVFVRAKYIDQIDILFIDQLTQGTQFGIFIGTVLLLHFLHFFMFRFKFWLIYDIIKQQDVTEMVVELHVERKSDSSNH